MNIDEVLNRTRYEIFYHDNDAQRITIKVVSTYVRAWREANRLSKIYNAPVKYKPIFKE